MFQRIRHIRKSAALMALICSLAINASLMATDYYIHPNGSDSNSGSIDAPWRTIHKANITLQAGDRVFIRAGNYAESINPVNNGQEGQYIVFSGYDGEEAIIRGPGAESSEAVIALGYPGPDAGWRGAQYIKIEKLKIEPLAASYGAAIYGRYTIHNIISECEFVCSNPTDPRNHGILVGTAKNTLIENNRFSGDWDLGIITTATPQYTIIRGNEITSPIGSCIDVQTSYGQNQSMLIEGNTLLGSRTEDGIQFEPDYAQTFDNGTMRGVVIRNNIIGNHAENGVDLKGAAHVVIEGNTIFGCTGDNDGSGNLGGGTGGIMKGDIGHTQAHNILIRRNFIYDNLGGVSIHNKAWVVVHNTIVGNNRSHLGADCSAQQIETAPTDFLRRLPGLVGVMMMEPYAPSFDASVIKNNIIAGNHQGEIAVMMTGDLDNAEINGNCYQSDETGVWASVQSTWDWNKINHNDFQSELSGITGLLGQDEASIVTDNVQWNLSNDHPIGQDSYDYSLNKSSPAIDAGQPLTTVTSAGSGTVMPVHNARYFSDGYGIVDGDDIVLLNSGQTARVVAVDTDNNTIELDRALSWQAGESISYPYIGQAPDIGAIESQFQLTELDVQIQASVNQTVVEASVNFEAATGNGEGDVQYTWTLGDAEIGQGAIFDYAFSEAGVYSLQARARDSQGNTGTGTVTIEVKPQLSVQITLPLSKSLLVPATSAVNSIVDGGIEPYQYQWTVNGEQRSADPQMTVTFNETGTYDVQLTVTDQQGNTRQDVVQMIVYAPLGGQVIGSLDKKLPPANWTLTMQPEGGQSPYNYSWKVNGIAVDGGQQALYTIASAGNYEAVCLTSDASGQQFSDTLNLQIKESFDFTLTSAQERVSGPAPFTITLSANGEDGFNYEWSSSNGETGSGSTWTVTFSEAGQHMVECKGIHSSGETAIQTQLIDVYEALTAVIEPESQNADMTDWSYHAEVNGGKLPYQYTWTFQDGSSSTEQDVQKAYMDAGIYTVQLKVIDADNNETSTNIQTDIPDKESQVTIAAAAISSVQNAQSMDRLVAGYWFKVKVNLSPESQWENLGYIDVVISQNDVDWANDRGGAFNEKENYVISLSASDETVWVREKNNSVDWKDITGTLGKYIDARDGKIIFSPSGRYIEFSFKASNKVESGNWKLSSRAVDKNALKDEPFTSEVVMQSINDTPSIEIDVPSRSTDEIVIEVKSSTQLSELPTDFVFYDSNGKTWPLTLSGNLPGKTLHGKLSLLSGQVANGAGQFWIGYWSLKDEKGNRGHEISKGQSLTIDNRPPQKPQNVTITQ